MNIKQTFLQFLESKLKQDLSTSYRFYLAELRDAIQMLEVKSIEEIAHFKKQGIFDVYRGCILLEILLEFLQTYEKDSI